MRPERTLRKLDRTLGIWRAQLGPLDDAAFARTPDGGGWSVGQICHHLRSASDLLLGNAEQCAAGDGRDMGFQVFPAIMALIGSIPPARIKVPDLPEELRQVSQPVQLGREDGLAVFDGIEERMREMRAAMESASPRCRRRHPAGGWMNAVQWYQLNEMHMRHHLRQLARTI
jgi:hypothetical protein